MPKQSNKQQETYADMTALHQDGVMENVIPIGIYCYFAFDCCSKVAKFRIVKYKALINAIQYVEIYPDMRTYPPPA